jgi:hypothetical protein
MDVWGNSGPYGWPVSGLSVSGDAVPYGEPRTLAQKMKKRLGSNAFPRPMRGPHLCGRLSGVRRSRRGHGPVFDVCTAGEGVADDHDVVFGVVEPAPCLVRDRDVSQKAPIFERKGGHDVDGLFEDGHRGSK